MNNNIDTVEVAKFNNLAQQWWDQEGDFKTLHQINLPRLQYITQRTGSLRNKSILDIGCGGGILAESMAKQGALVTAIDPASDSVAAAIAHAGTQPIEIDYQVTTAEALAENMAEKYDIVTCMEMLEHVPQPNGIIRACATLCKPGGPILLSTINRTAKAFLLAIVGAEYLLKLLPAGTHQYEKFIRPSEISNWARAYSLDIMDITGLHYNPLTQHASLNKDVTVNYMMHLQKTDA